MEKEFTKYNQALALKELGFNEPCFGYYEPNGNLKYVESHIVKDFPYLAKNSEWQDLVAASTFSQAFRWFREKYELHSYIYSDYSWNISGGIWDLNGYKDLKYDWDSEPYATYEEAESACLDELIEICKNKQNYMEKRFKVSVYQNNTYEVLEKQYYAYEDDDFYESVFQGSLSDCEEYIRLHEGGYM